MVTQIKNSEHRGSIAASNQKMFNNKTKLTMKKFNFKKAIALAAIATGGFMENVNAQWDWNSSPPSMYNINGGNVGIGIVPSSVLHVRTAATGDGVTITQAGGGTNEASLFLQNTAAGSVFWSLNHNSTGDFHLFESAGGGNTRLFIENTTGNVGIGTGVAAPTAKLDVDGGNNTYGIYGQTTSSGGSSYGIYGELFGTLTSGISAAVYGKNSSANSGGTGYAGYFDGDVEINGDVTVNGSGVYSGTWAWSSDRRFKKDISRLDNMNVAEKIQKLNGYTYKFRADEFKEKNFDKRTHIGFIAQELKEVFPELVKEDAKGFYSVDYIGMIPVLLEAVKEQEQKINNLENQLAASQKQNSTTSVEELNSANGFYMEQNKPNPFDQSTLINYNLPASVNTAYLMVCDYSGKKIVTYNLTAKTGSVTIEAKDLPAEGIYLYSIVSNGEVFGTKKMVLTK